MRAASRKLVTFCGTTVRESLIPKLDVAGSTPVARSTLFSQQNQLLVKMSGFRRQRSERPRQPFSG